MPLAAGLLLVSVHLTVTTVLAESLTHRFDAAVGLWVMTAGVVGVALAYTVSATVPPLPVVGDVLVTVLFANCGVVLAFTIAKQCHEPTVAGTVTSGSTASVTLTRPSGGRDRGLVTRFWIGEVNGGAACTPRWVPGQFRRRGRGGCIRHLLCRRAQLPRDQGRHRRNVAVASVAEPRQPNCLIRGVEQRHDRRRVRLDRLQDGVKKAVQLVVRREHR